ncbi:OmpA family protein [Vibrio hannami]|uniref:OmpA family protein n=1 Tax=Vibrio hannami TaxID=2717094 RepID=UPI00241043AD|nr:OmpA family protein [Vibrio hannami]MDG3085968.1 OmpA family protein [Vibrio hannami]
MSERNLKLIPILLIAASSVTGAYADEMQRVDDSISFFCAKKEVNTQETMKVGQATQVNLNAGPFALLQSESDYQGALNLVSEEMLKMGVTSECAEYLLSKGSVKMYQDGHVFARVYFDFDKANLTRESQYVLNSVIQTLDSSPSDLLLEGHTDNIGSNEYNFSLGLKRSEAAKSYLANGGVEKSRITAVSKGETTPIASNNTADGRKQNRRVEIIKATEAE